MTQAKNLLTVLFCLICLVSLPGCPPIDDGAEPTGSSADAGTDGTREEENTPTLGADCQCEDDETVCQADCPEALICAALSCSHECDSDDDCPDGFVCAGVAETDFDNQGMSNLGRKYCFEN